MGIRISEMEEATTFGADDYVPIVSNGTNKKALGQKIKDFIAGFFVSKSGDTMTGDFTIAKDNPYEILKNTNLTVSTDPANGVTTSKVGHYTIQDSTGAFFSRIYGVAETSGRIATVIEARNMKTDGTRVSNTLSVSVQKDGTRLYGISDPTAFRAAINTTTASITRQSGVSSSTPLPTIARSGNVVIIHFAQQFSAGTYYELYNVSPKPISSEHAIVDIGSNKNVIYLSNDGKLRFNNSITLSSAQYVIGQIVYLTDD